MVKKINTNRKTFNFHSKNTWAESLLASEFNSLYIQFIKSNSYYYLVSLFSAPGTSTSSEIPLEEQQQMGLTDGLIRFSIGLDNDIERTYNMMRNCMVELGILS